MSYSAVVRNGTARARVGRRLREGERGVLLIRVLDPSLSQYFTEIATAWEDTPDPHGALLAPLNPPFYPLPFCLKPHRASIAANALEEARGKEHQLLWDTQTCRTLEPLLKAAPPAAAARFLAGACCCAGKRVREGGEGAGGGGEGSGEREVNVCRDVLAHGLASRVIEAGLRNIRAWVTGESRTRGSAGLDETGAGDDENEEQDREGEEEEENEGGTGGQGDLPKWTGTVRVVLKKICKEVTEYPLAAMTSPACSHVLRSLLLLLACRPIHDTPAAAEGTRKARRDGAEGGAGFAGGKDAGAAAGGAEAAAAAERGRRVGAALGFPALLRKVVVGVTAAAAGADEAVPSAAVAWSPAGSASAAVAWSPYADSWTLACDPSAGPLLQVVLDVIRDDAALLTHVITSLLHLPEAALRAAAKKRKRAGPGRQEGGSGKKRSRREQEERGEGGEEGDEEEGRGGAEGGEEGEETDQQVEEEVGQILELMKDRCGSRFMETVIQLAPPSLRSSLLRVALLPHLLPLALHPIANYTVQTALSALHSPTDVKRAFKALAGGGQGEGGSTGSGAGGGEAGGGDGGEGGGRGEGLLALLKGGRGRVVLALLIACGRTKTFQARACDSLLAAISSSPAPSPVDAAAAADAAAVGDLLWLDAWLAVRVNDMRSNRAKKRQQQQGWGSVPVAERGAVSFVGRAKKRQQQQGWGSVPVAERGAVSFVGCMALQTIFSFPLAASQRVVQACVALPPSYLMHLATDVKGTRVLSAFFRAAAVPLDLKTTMLTRYHMHSAMRCCEGTRVLSAFFRAATVPLDLKTTLLNRCGTRVLSAFFRAATVPLDLKTTLLNSLKPRLTTIAADRLGAFVVSAAFDTMTVEGKQMILAELATRYSSASSSLLQRPLFRHMGLAEYLESPEAWQKQQQRKEGLLREFKDLLAAPSAFPSLAPAPAALPSSSTPDAKPCKKKREPAVEATASAATKKTKSGKKRRGGDEGEEGEEGRHGGGDVGSREGGKSGGALRGIVEQLNLGSEMAMLGFSGEGGEMGQEEMEATHRICKRARCRWSPWRTPRYTAYDSPNLHAGALSMEPVAYTTVVIGLAVVVQIIGLVCFGAEADFGQGRWRMLLVGTLMGAVPCILCLALTSPSLWWLAGLFAIIANLGYGISLVGYNSYLPVLVDASPKVLAAGPDEASILAVREKVREAGGRPGNGHSRERALNAALLAITLLIPDDLLKLRVTVAVCGLWWITLSAFTFAWLHPRPGPPMPKTGFSMLNRWLHLFRLFKEASRYRYAFIFLICLVAYSSGFTTMLQMAVLFGQNDLCLSVSSMAIIALTVAVVAIAGMPLALLFQRKTHATNKTMVVILLTCLVPLPVWGFIGYFTADGGFGLKSAWEIYLCAAWLGFFLGALTSYSRTLFIDFIPVGREGAFFTLFFICDRISSCIGPFVIAAVTQVGGQLRPVFGYVFLVLVIPAISVQLFVNYNKGVAEAGRATKHQERLQEEGLHESTHAHGTQVVHAEP
ncbi:unnamed protein product [Closterium sp. Naga37s-1]|nr:unnamed protein product [Closterium sp. Naga37s-1]